MANNSPFPGMDPWLEGHWSDVHHGVTQYILEQISPELPADLYATIDVTLHIVSPRQESRWFRPDVAVIDWGEPLVRTISPSSSTTAEPPRTTPIKIRFHVDPVKVATVEIREQGNPGSLVTCIKVISPANKLDAEGRAKYERKREACLQSGVNFVEIDLLRSGRKLVGVPDWYLSEHVDRDAPYKCCVQRCEKPGDVELEYYPLLLRERLARIAIPLRKTDADVTLDLQLPVDKVYAVGRYAGRINYESPPVPPLSAEDAEWAAGLTADIRRGT